MSNSPSAISDDRDVLADGEMHPAMEMAKIVISDIGIDNLRLLQGAMSSTAIESNRLAEICCGTIDRILKDEPVGERYLLGLALTICSMADRNAEIIG